METKKYVIKNESIVKKVSEHNKRKLRKELKDKIKGFVWGFGTCVVCVAGIAIWGVVTQYLVK